MATSLLVVTPSPSFGELIRRPLEDTGNFRVHVVSSKAAAIVRADEESCRIAFLDIDLGEAWIEEVGQSLRTVIPNIKLFILASDETPPALDSIRPWTLLRKPLQAPEVLKTIGQSADLAGAAGGPRDPLWLMDVNKAAQHLTRLTLASASQAALITRENEVWAYAGQLSQEAAIEIAKVLSRNWDSSKGGDLLRFVRLEATHAEHMLYATQLGEGLLLAMVFDAETPFSTIRTQAGQLATSLAEGDASDEPAAPEAQDLEAVPPALSDLEGEDDDGMEMPPISEILKDIPIPDPRGSLVSPRLGLFPAAPPLVAEKDPVEPAPLINEPVSHKPWVEPVQTVNEPAQPLAGSDPVAFPPGPLVVPAPPLEGAVTQPSAFSHESFMPTQMKAASRDDTARPDQQAHPLTPVSAADQTVASRPETPIHPPLPGEQDETRPSSVRAELASSELNAGPIIMEPITAGVYHLSYACLLLPRFTTHYLTGDVADKLSEWIPIICVAFGWRLEHLAVRPEYLQWVVNVPPATSPGYVMRVIRQQLSDKVFAAFPRLKRDNPSGDFWAPGYLIMGGTQPHPPQLVKDYIKQIRTRQGVEKPQGANRSRR
ncbi:MAG TPA: transposase [Anaerolineales bacterium]|nr:transposase [Anaerolineales bacterium]